MAEYIEREALIAELAKGTIISNDLYGMGIMSGIDFAMKRIVGFPAADVVEVVHGRWLVRHKGQNNWVDCSECGTVGSPFWKRCPVCEAKMDLEATP